MMEESKRKVATLIVDFSINTIAGQESGLYKSYGTILPLTRNFLKTTMIGSMFSGIIANYLNRCYRSLILDDDEYVTTKFNEMTSIMNHSKICFLNIIAEVIKVLFENINRATLDISTYEKYMNCIMSQLNNSKDELIDTLSHSLSHECEGDDIKQHNPDKPMFYCE